MVRNLDDLDRQGSTPFKIVDEASGRGHGWRNLTAHSEFAEWTIFPAQEWNGQSVLEYRGPSFITTKPLKWGKSAHPEFPKILWHFNMAGAHVIESRPSHNITNSYIQLSDLQGILQSWVQKSAPFSQLPIYQGMPSWARRTEALDKWLEEAQDKAHAKTNALRDKYLQVMMVTMTAMMMMKMMTMMMTMSLQQVCMGVGICMKPAADLNCIANGCQFNCDNHHHQQQQHHHYPHH